MTIRTPQRMAALLLLLLAACATTPETPPGYEGNIYRDPERGIEAILPAGWVFVSPDQFPALMSEGTNTLVGDDPALNASMAEASTRMSMSFMMVNATRLDAPETITLASEKMSSLHIGLTAETYAMALASDLRRVGFWVSDVKKEAPVSIGGNVYRLLRAHFDVENTTMYQSYYLRVVEKELYYFVVTHHEQGRSDALLEILRTVQMR